MTHFFCTTGIKTIRIDGVFPQFGMNQNGYKLLSIDQWGTNPWKNMSNSFNQNLDNWDTGKVTTMIDMFNNAILFNQNIGSWNTYNVTSMYGMFYSAKSFDQNLGEWNVSNVVYFNEMFENIRLSVENYDALLVGWNLQNLSSDEIFQAGDSVFCSESAQFSHRNMISSFNWTISDGGVCEESLNIVTNHMVFDENSVEVIKINYTDPDFDTPSFALTGGDDMNLFQIDSNTGELSFNNPPDYESPIDFDDDNIYMVEVTAVDGGMPSEADTQLIKV